MYPTVIPGTTSSPGSTTQLTRTPVMGARIPLKLLSPFRARPCLEVAATCTSGAPFSTNEPTSTSSLSNVPPGVSITTGTCPSTVAGVGAGVGARARVVVSVASLACWWLVQAAGSYDVECGHLCRGPRVCSYVGSAPGSSKTASTVPGVTLSPRFSARTCWITPALSDLSVTSPKSATALPTLVLLFTGTNQPRNTPPNFATRPN
mmetsp:Transcript_53779/g.143960  ORF Transcript_53779/g.143960 Transcript_53779/m.143960 type:complete len:206 (+) Transcript_53779:1329-1946(+)